LVFFRQDGTEFADTPGITLNADGNFAPPVPEPSGLALLAAGAVSLGLATVRQRKGAGARNLTSGRNAS
jgi:hypothetical protein